ncbi:MAG: DUF1566 domain-containing protein [Leptospiraceae bacterium]|nr:DUF1566 domain-containing protein [Leptospiraceae bacterium]
MIVKYLISFILIAFGSCTLSQSRIKIEKSEVVKDPVTGLAWQKCSAGQSGNNCEIGKASEYNWLEAGKYCNTLEIAGKPARLPTVVELDSLFYFTNNKSPPHIDKIRFPNTVLSYYWSSTSNALNPMDAWYVVFGNGVVGSYRKVGTGSVRCVTGG